MTGSPTTYASLHCLSIRTTSNTTQVIAFWEEYLEREELTHYPQARIVLLRPSMAYMLMITPDPLTIKSALPKFDGITHIFLPINDNPDAMRPEGGAHWSLLLVSIIDGVSFHYDSMFPHNSGEARKTSRKLEVLLNKHLRFVDMNDAPQQANGSDCGVFVCLNMRHLLLERLLKVDANNKITMTMRADDVNSVQGRKEIYKLIEDLRKEGERRRSCVHTS